VVGNLAWVAESKFALRNDPNNKDPGPWVINSATQRGSNQFSAGWQAEVSVA
jgi:hypothetical protein